MKKRWLSLLMAAAMLTGILAGCAPKPVEVTPAAAAEKEDASGEAGGAGTQAAQDTAPACAEGGGHALFKQYPH